MRYIVHPTKSFAGIKSCLLQMFLLLSWFRSVFNLRALFFSGNPDLEIFPDKVGLVLASRNGHSVSFLFLHQDLKTNKSFKIFSSHLVMASCY